MHKHSVFFMVFLIVFLLCVPVSAAELTVDPGVSFCFSSADFIQEETEDGIFLTAVPKQSVAVVYYNGRALHAGDALPADALNDLTLETRCMSKQSTAIEYCTAADGTVSDTKALNLSILPKKNDPPEAKDCELETYRNITVSGQLNGTDPENDVLTYQITTEPKRGSVTLSDDGSFVYTPNENKVGKDKFTFTVTDSAGQTSEPAEVRIEILKPADKRVYADMSGDPDAFTAMWLKESGLFEGSTVAGNLCFEPDAVISRGDFLVMTMGLVQADADQTNMVSGFADEAATPVWMQPYIVSALRNGMISGTEYETGLEFRPEAALTSAEAAVMLQNTLQLPLNSSTPVGAFESDSMMPDWAADSVAALASAGIELDVLGNAEPMTRRDAARVLYQVAKLLENDVLPTFYWIS